MDQEKQFKSSTFVNFLQCYSKTKDIVCKSYMRTLNKQQEGKENKNIILGELKSLLKAMRLE